MQPELEREKNRANILNEMLYSAVCHDIDDLARLAIAKGATLSGTEGYGNELILFTIKNNNKKLQKLLLDSGLIVNEDAITSAAKLLHSGEAFTDTIISVIPYVNWEHAESLLMLMVEVVVKPQPKLLAAIQEHVRLDWAIENKGWWIGRIFDYVRDEHDDFFSFMNNIDVSRFSYVDKKIEEERLKSTLLKRRCYRTLNYLIERGAFSSGNKFNEKYYDQARFLNEMKQMGYNIQCDWELHIFSKDEDKLKRLFIEERNARENLISALHLLKCAPEFFPERLFCHNIINQIFKNVGEVSPLLNEGFRQCLYTLIDKGYFEDIKIDFKNLYSITITKEDGPNKKYACLLRFLLLDDKLREKLFSCSVEVANVNADTLEYASVDDIAVKSWLSQYRYDAPIFNKILDEFLESSTGRDSLFLLLKWNALRFEKDIQSLKNKGWKKLVKAEDANEPPEGGEYILCDRIKIESCRFNQNNMTPRYQWAMFCCSDKKLASLLHNFADKALWKRVCDITGRTPMDYLKVLPRNGAEGCQLILTEMLA